MQYSAPELRIDKKRTFYFSQQAVIMMNLKEGDGIMIYLSHRDKCAYIRKENDESYILKSRNVSLHFTNTPASNTIVDFFKIEHHFPVFLTIREKDGKFFMFPRR